jgi:phenylacetate-CoA ligase
LEPTHPPDMHGYETLRQRHMLDAMALAPQLIERLEWPADRLAEHRRASLRAAVADAVAHSPWHGERFAGVDLTRLDEESLRELPPMTKRDLMDNFDRIVTDPRLTLEGVNAHLDTVEDNGYLLDRYTAITSGGSSGERGVFVYDWEGWSIFWLSCFRHLLRAKESDPELASRPLKVAWVAAGHFAHATAALGRTFAGPNLTTFRFPVTLPVDQIVAGLNKAQPDALNAYPSALHVLAVEAQAGRLRIRPRRVQSAAEPLLPEIRAAAEAAWGVRVGNLYGVSEGGGAAVPCAHQRSHLSEDLMIVEPVDEAGRPTPPGTRAAKIYLTNLYNRTLPLIRYEITDEVTILAQPCPCGLAHRCIADIQGRLDDVFIYAGRRVHPHVFRSVLALHAGVTEYQVRQTRDGARIALRCAAPVDLQAIRKQSSEALAGLGLTRPTVEVEVVERLPRHPGTAKLKRFVPIGDGPSSEPGRVHPAVHSVAKSLLTETR